MNGLDMSFLNSNTFLFAVIFGAIPSFLWMALFFRKSHGYGVSSERRILSFFIGMVLVVLTLPLQHIFVSTTVTQAQTLFFVLLEEFLKIGSVLLLMFIWSKSVQRPMEYVVYAVCIALGFSVLENSLYFLNAIQLQQYDILITALVRRFEGPTLMHSITLVFPVALIGTQFFKSKQKQLQYGVLGFGLAVVLHFFFNSFIDDVFFVTVIGLWACGIVTLFFVSIVKKISTDDYLKKREQGVFDKTEQMFNLLVGDFKDNEASILRDSIPDHKKLSDFLVRFREEYVTYLLKIGDEPSQAIKVAESVISENMSIKTCKIIFATLRK